MVCQHSQADLRENLHLSRFSKVNRIRRFFGVTQLKYKDNAPWINAILSHFSDQTLYEMHVVSPHIGMKKNIEEFELGGVYFHFYKNYPSTSVIGILGKLFPNYCPTYRINKNRVEQIIDTINPKLILLIGIEDPSYSTTILDIKNIPIFVMSQTILQDPDFSAHFAVKRYEYLTNLEKSIFNRSGYVGVYTENHYKWLKNSGYKGNIFNFTWPEKNAPLATPQDGITKENDFINFATRMSDEKGYPDSIKALAIVKQKYPNVTLNLIDTGSTREKQELLSLIISLNLEQNVSFTPFFEKKTDLFQHIQKARFGVLPCKLDFFSGTMIQCMQYGVPITVYKTEGTPTLNHDANCVLIAELNDISGLAENMLKLLKDEALAERLKSNSLEYIQKRHQKNAGSMNRLIDDFSAIIDNYYHNAAIPKNLLYKEYPQN